MQVRAFHTRYSVTAKRIAAKQKMSRRQKYHKNAKGPETGPLQIRLVAASVLTVAGRCLSTDAPHEDRAGWLVVDVTNGICRLAENHGFDAEAVNDRDPRPDLLVHQRLRE